MRVDVKTKGPVRDKEIKAMYLISFCLEHLVSERMREATLRFFCGRYGFDLAVRK